MVVLNLGPPVSASQVTKVIYMDHHAQLCLYLLFSNVWVCKIFLPQLPNKTIAYIIISIFMLYNYPD